jgi:hypothetical protein
MILKNVNDKTQRPHSVTALAWNVICIIGYGLNSQGSSRCFSLTVYKTSLYKLYISKYYNFNISLLCGSLFGIDF